VTDEKAAELTPVRNVHGSPVDLEGGGVVGAGEEADVDLSLAHNKAHVDSGALVALDKAKPKNPNNLSVIEGGKS
jgi:hypothetical protein